MAHLAASIWVSTPPEVVFHVMEAPQEQLLPSGAPRLAVLDSPGRAGARYRWEFRRWGLGFRLDSAVSEYHPPQRMALKSIAGWQMDACADLVPEAGGTRLNFRMNYRFPAPLRWLVPGPLIRVAVWHALRQIKSLSENALPVRALSN